MDIASTCLYALSDKAQKDFRLLVGISARFIAMPVFAALILVVVVPSQLGYHGRAVIITSTIIVVVLFRLVESAIFKWRLDCHISAVYVTTDHSSISFATLAETPRLIHFDVRDVRFQVIRSGGYRRRIGKIKFIIQGRDTMNLLIENTSHTDAEDAVLLLRDILVEIPAGKKLGTSAPK